MMTDLSLLNCWNTWDVRHVNAVMRMSDLAQVRVGFYDNQRKLYKDEFFATEITKYGMHDLYGRYSEIEIKFQGSVYKLESASNGDQFVYKVSPQGSPLNSHLKFYISGLFRWGGKGNCSIAKEGHHLILQSDKRKYAIQVVGEIDESTLVNGSHLGITLHADKPIYIQCNSTMTIPEMESVLAKNKGISLNDAVKGQNALNEVPEAIMKGMLWNTVYDRVKDRLVTPVARTWCLGKMGEWVMFGSYVLFCWDTFLSSLLCGIQDKKLAYQQIYSILQEVSSRGMIPNFSGELRNSEDRSQPPVGAFCVLKLYEQFGDIVLLEQTFEALLKWNQWWTVNRDGNQDGLLEWGSDPYPDTPENTFIAGVEQVDDLTAAKWESGLDNSPMYDEVIYNKASHTMELSDVGLNSLYALDCRALSKIAELLGKQTFAISLAVEYERVKTLVNFELWNEEKGIYMNKDWKGAFNERVSPTCFYPMLAGIATPEQAQRMMNEHLLNENRFWGEFVIPSVPKDDPAYLEQDYWRGYIWGPMNYLVYEGIKNYKFHDAAFAFAEKSNTIFMKEWKLHSQIRENYHAITGEGTCTHMQTWGGLLGYVYTEEFISASAWGGYRFGNLSGVLGGLNNFPLGSDRYTVDSGSHLIVDKNGEPYIRANVPVLITDWSIKNRVLHCSVEHRMAGELVLTINDDADEFIIFIIGLTGTRELRETVDRFSQVIALI
ncbi:hypothetical protein EHS13_09975 [Paenibacillus psychroresistens]|uniref:Mannosylglycerate hydrolase MGH1-like glycoside hydrolase domain-containing protein n=1 Tax=Paenibacillus psychroresistens TaxID=1778678 RepID=A0A6B8RG82_9BACL|nr:trehalase family glycosidase [Paenibacillus psychroresistens]QGQ95190.1 hypothetical protein EHS13_09975 [Paenibacillus psychroresistens]